MSHDAISTMMMPSSLISTLTFSKLFFVSEIYPNSSTACCDSILVCSRRFSASYSTSIPLTCMSEWFLLPKEKLFLLHNQKGVFRTLLSFFSPTNEMRHFPFIRKQELRSVFFRIYIIWSVIIASPKGEANNRIRRKIKTMSLCMSVCM